MINNFSKIIAAFILFSSASIEAQELVYNPINPSFIGGNTFNYQWLLSSAQAQNTITEGSTVDRFSRDPLTDFQESLNRQILGEISRELVSNVFGETGGLEEGRYEIGSFTIDIVPASDGINITIFDITTGGETTVIVPYF